MNTYVISSNCRVDMHYTAASINDAIARYRYNWGMNLPDISDWQYDAKTNTYTYENKNPIAIRASIKVVENKMNTYVIKTHKSPEIRYESITLSEALARHYHDWGVNLPDIDKGNWQYNPETNTYTHENGSIRIEA